MTSKTIVLITGGNAGIGYETVAKLAADHPSTHHILMGTRSLAKGASALKALGSPSNVSPLELDITSDASIAAAVSQIKETYGKLDVLVNNAGTAGANFGDVVPPSLHGKDKTLREVYTHVYGVNVISTAVLTDALTPLLDAASPGPAKVIFISSTLGSIGTFVAGYHIVQCPWYNSSKAAVNYLSAWYSRVKPEWRVNAVCPGLNATGLNHVPLNEETHPKNGAVRACELVDQGAEGVTGTYSRRGLDKESGDVIPW
ncbi:NAD(P)-binding protein [Mytilinidion resinicola]|uniref:NAD(P)-binding protein n=1 Tax=Mytilinidion resinicola TaxID=574789 RepID=A0A6A6Y5P2_9PEZI|nr:NAD(P)-binding protein [Mytilinidion resinicola]KAF2804161.1 NAD(P)-binding protein [Mytilinidion resinicola]